MWNTGLAFDAADEDALDEVALDKGIDQQDGDGAYHSQRRLERLGGGAIVSHDRVVEDTAQQRVTQQQLDRLLQRRVDKDGRVKPGVPMEDSVEQADGGEDGHRQGNDDPRQDG